jgi:hypothetical protein
MKVNAIGDSVLASMVKVTGGHRVLASGILVADKDMTESGIRPRWFKVESVGPNVTFVEEGQFVYVEHGRWSNEMKIQQGTGNESTSIWLLDSEKCLLVSDSNPINNGYEM